MSAYCATGNQRAGLGVGKFGPLFLIFSPFPTLSTRCSSTRAAWSMWGLIPGKPLFMRPNVQHVLRKATRVQLQVSCTCIQDWCAVCIFWHADKKWETNVSLNRNALEV